MALRTDYKNDVLNTSVNEERRFEEVTNPDGSKSYRDVTEYSQIGDSFDADLVNTQNAEINAKAPIDSPAFTGNPTAPTKAQSIADDSLATTAFVKSALINAIDPNLRTSGKAADAQVTGNRIASVQASIPTIDTTLTTNGAAADALATGNAISEKYTKPSSGIPKTDLANSVQTTLTYADTIKNALTNSYEITDDDFVQARSTYYQGYIVKKGLYKITAYDYRCSFVVSPPFAFDSADKVEAANNITNTSVYFEATKDYHSCRVWMANTQAEDVKALTVKRLAPLTLIDNVITSGTDYDYLLVSGHTYHFFGAGSSHTYRLYDIDGNSTELFSAKSISHTVFTADKQYVRVQVWKNSASAGNPLSVLIYDEEYAPKNIERTIEWRSGDINGAGAVVSGSTAVGVPLNGYGLYVIAFPNTLQVKVNMDNAENGGRINKTFTTPFSFFSTNAVIAVYNSDGTVVSADDARLSDVHVYCVPKSRESRYDVSIAASNSYENDKIAADIVCGGVDDAPILCAVFGCWDSVNVLLYGGDYYVNSLYTMSDGSQCAIRICDENPLPSANGMFRRCLTVEGDSMCVPPTFKPVNIRVSESLHESLSDSKIDQYIIALPYQYGTTITKSYTAIVFKNFNVIGWYYDKPITYIDISRALNIIIESVNVRSWWKDLASYTRLEQIPHEECVGLRIGIGNQYGVQNSLKHSNYWYLGKAVVCNGEHFVIEDIKTHHDYIGFVFGDRTTIGYMQHPLIMIGCSIENCYRLMLFTKNNVKTEQDWKPNAGLGSKSTFICIGLSTENHWDTPGGEGYVLTLPALEVIKNVYRGRFECDFHRRPFETGSGNKIACTWYDGDGAHFDS